MTDALRSDSRSAEVMDLGMLRPFGSYAGKPGGHTDAVNIWEYSMLMHQTQFVPLPAGISAEQFRVWEAFEAGAAFPAFASSLLVSFVLVPPALKMVRLAACVAPHWLCSCPCAHPWQLVPRHLPDLMRACASMYG
jgi:hypothetical protein